MSNGLAVECANSDALIPPANDVLLQVNFLDGNRASCLGKGWVVSDRGAVSVGCTSALHLPTGSLTVLNTVELEVEPWTGSPEVLGQLINITAGQQKLVSFVVTQQTILRFKLPRDLHQPDAKFDLSLDYPCFVRPATLGAGGDDQAFAITLRSLRVTSENDVTEAPAAPPSAPTLTPMAAIVGHPATSHYDFANADDKGRVLRDGFHVGTDGTAWTSAAVSRMVFEQCLDGAHLLRLSLIPLCFNGGPSLQRLTVILNGFVVGQFRLNTETTLTLLLPARLLEGRSEHRLSMITPDAVRMSRFTPGKTEALGFAVDWVELEAAGHAAEAAAQIRRSEIGSANVVTFNRFNDVPVAELEDALEDGLDLQKLFRKFESIGDSCTFGLAQRKIGIEVLNLLRFANTPLPGLLAGLRAEFAAAKDKAEITVEKDSANELVVWIRRYGIRWHTFQYETSTTAAKVHEDHVVKLAYLRRKFLEGLGRGEKIYVLARLNSRRYRRAVPNAHGVAYWEAPLRDLQLSEVMAIWQELNRKRENTLLYILPSDAAHPPGTVEQLTPTLLRGYVERTVMRAVMDVSAWDHSDWIKVLANAWHSRPAPALPVH